MPKHDKVCHGDFNPSNIIVTKDGGLYILDWAHATQGNASADVARTYLLFCLEGDRAKADKYLDLFCKKSDTAKRTFKSGFRSLPLPSPLRASPKSVTSCSRG